MQRHWGRMAANGDPGEWPAYVEGVEQSMTFDLAPAAIQEEVAMKQDTELTECIPVQRNCDVRGF